MENMEDLINILFNLGFKNCKYCKKPFYPQHNRQEHCKTLHRKYYKQERYIAKRRKQRHNEPKINYIDAHGKYINCKASYLVELGSKKSSLKEHKCNTFQQEAMEVHKQLKALGIK